MQASSTAIPKRMIDLLNNNNDNQSISTNQSILLPLLLCFFKKKNNEIDVNEMSDPHCIPKPNSVSILHLMKTNSDQFLY